MPAGPPERLGAMERSTDQQRRPASATRPPPRSEVHAPLAPRPESLRPQAAARLSQARRLEPGAAEPWAAAGGAAVLAGDTATVEGPGRPRPSSAAALGPRPAAALPRRPLSAGAAVLVTAQAQPGGNRGELTSSLGLAKVLRGWSKDGAAAAQPWAAQLQATVMQLAPTSRVAPCRSAACCWRWATEVLVEECEAESRATQRVRLLLEEERGNSARQQLAELRTEHEALLPRWHETREELERLRRRHDAFLQGHTEAIAARAGAEEALNAAQRDHQLATMEARARIQELEARLADVERQPAATELEVRLRETSLKAATLLGNLEQAQAELLRMRIERTDLEWKVQQLDMAVGKKGKDAKRRKAAGLKGRAGARRGRPGPGG